MTRTRYLRIAHSTSQGTSPEQRALLAAIRRLTAARGFPPTRRELATATGCRVNNVQKMLLRLRRDGLVEWQEGAARTIREVRE